MCECVSVCVFVCVCVFMCVMFVSLHQSECVCADSYMHASKALQRVKEKEDKMESRMRENKRERLKNVHVCVCVCSPNIGTSTSRILAWFKRETPPLPLPYPLHATPVVFCIE